jgi:hypothetical protein
VVAATKKKSAQTKRERKTEGASAPIRRQLERVRRARVQSDSWIKEGRPEGGEPWRDIDWTALSHLPEGREVLRDAAVGSGVRSLAELRDMLSKLGSKTQHLLRPGRSPASPIADVIFRIGRLHRCWE